MASAPERLPAAGDRLPLPRRPWFDDRLDRLLFLLFFGGGFALILAIKLAGQALVTFRGEPVAPRLLAAFAAAGLLVLYAFLASQTRTFRLHPERLGDNCYYLGLLYTLASLSAALIELERATPEARGALIESLLASFGIALISTILGIALRVWFVQMRREIEDLEAELQRDLQEAAQKLKDQLLLAVTELETFRLRTQQVLEERLQQATNTLTASAERHAQALGELAERLLARLDTTVEAVARRIEDLDRLAESLLEAQAHFAERLRTVEIPVDLFSRPAWLLEQTVRRVITAIEASDAAHLRWAASFAEQLRTFEEQLAKFIEATGTLTARFASAGAGASGLEALTRELEPSRAALVGFRKSLDELLQAARDDTKEIRGLRDQIRADLAEYHRLLKELGNGLAEVAETIVRRLEQ